jgi:prolyl oligopeptidase
MRIFSTVAVCLLSLPLFMSSFATAQTAPPKAKVEVVSETLHGVTINDPYRWLEDQKSPETRQFVESQMAYTKSIIDKAPNRSRLEKRLKQLMDVEATSSPAIRKGRYFFSRRMPGQKQFVWLWRDGISGKDKVLLDANTLSSDGMKSFTVLDLVRDGKSVAYGVRSGGEDETTLAFRDVDSNTDFGDALPRARYSGAALTLDRKTVYYSRFTPAGPRVYRHSMGSDAAKDEVIFGEGYDPTNIIGLSLTDDQRYLILTIYFGSSSDKNEIWFRDLTKANSSFEVLVKDIPAEFGLDYASDGKVFIQTTYKAPNGRIMTADLNKPAMSNWKEVVPEGKFPLAASTLAGGHVITNTLENVVPKVRIYTPEGKLVREIQPPTIGVVSAPSGSWSSDEAFYGFNSLAQPATTYRYQISSGTQEVWFKSSAPVESAQFEVKQVWFESKDKTRVPMFIAHKRGLKLDGQAPTYLTAYGGFNIAVLPNYSANAVVWMEQGGIWAIPSLRGGNEFGEAWHRAGMLDKKQNVFDDFIAAAEFLIANKYTSKSKLAIAGGSNGGLLVGAAMTQRPDLFKAVVCSVPLLDMVRYHKFLVARYWVPEYGSAEVAEQFPYIYKYSPYHRVEKGVNYPATMIVSGDSDTRVDPSHARKMAAILQAAGSKNPVLLHYDTNSGHSAGLPVTKMIENSVDVLSFLSLQLGIN